MSFDINIVKPVVDLEGVLQPDYEIDVTLPEGFETEDQDSKGVDGTIILFNQPLTAQPLENVEGQKILSGIGESMQDRVEYRYSYAAGSGAYLFALTLAVLEKALPEFGGEGRYSPDFSKIEDSKDYPQNVYFDRINGNIELVVTPYHRSFLGASVINQPGMHYDEKHLKFEGFKLKGVCRLDEKITSMFFKKGLDVVLNHLYSQVKFGASKKNQKKYVSMFKDNSFSVNYPSVEKMEMAAGYLMLVNQFLKDNQNDLMDLTAQYSATGHLSGVRDMFMRAVHKQKEEHLQCSGALKAFKRESGLIEQELTEIYTRLQRSMDKTLTRLMETFPRTV